MTPIWLRVESQAGGYLATSRDDCGTILSAWGKTKEAALMWAKRKTAKQLDLTEYRILWTVQEVEG